MPAVFLSWADYAGHFHDTGDTPSGIDASHLDRLGVVATTQCVLELAGGE